MVLDIYIFINSSTYYTNWEPIKKYFVKITISRRIDGLQRSYDSVIIYLHHFLLFLTRVHLPHPTHGRWSVCEVDMTVTEISTMASIMKSICFHNKKHGPRLLHPLLQSSACKYLSLYSLVRGYKMTSTFFQIERNKIFTFVKV